MATAPHLTYSVEAYNLSHASENKIHDDNLARKLGFTGGLVPGVEVFAYATHPVVRYFGREFLEQGFMECRFAKPVYDGNIATAKAIETDDGLDITLESDGIICATGKASLNSQAITPPNVADYELSQPPQTRPPADETSLGVGRILGIESQKLTEELLTTYLANIRETDPIYATEGIAHTGLLLRQCNSLLRENVVLPPWIHTASSIRNFSAAKLNDTLSVRARVAANYERKGHRFVDLDCLIVANDQSAIAHVIHTAIYKLRHLDSH